MKIATLIDSDYKSLKRYFGKLFEVMEEEVENKKNAPLQAMDADDEEFPESFFRFNHFIKPDMLINIYSYLDFWLDRLSKYHKRRLKLSLGFKDIRGNNDLDAYKKYFSQYCGLKLEDINSIYTKLDDLRIIRNRLIHNGGFVEDGDEVKFKKIKDIKIHSSLIIISDDYVWNTLEYVKDFLLKIAKA